MPLVSRAQAAYLKHHHPDIYAEFKAATPKGKRLPYKKAKAKKKRAR